MRNWLLAILLLVPFTACSRQETPPPEAQPAPAAAPAPDPGPDRYPEKTEAGEAGVRKFVQQFMRARMRGNTPRARAFLSAEAQAQFTNGEGDLALTGAGITDWEFGSVKAADANSWEVQVRLSQDGPGGAVSAHEETLFVGPGTDARGQERPWVVRGAERTPVGGAVQ